MRLFLLMILAVFSLNTFASAGFMDVVKDKDEKVMRRHYSWAQEYCSDQGTSLPSARQLAHLAMNLGAKGIVNSCDNSDKECYLVEAVNEDGARDIFYYSQEGFKPAEGDLGNNTFWSSSSIINPSTTRNGIALSGFTGSLFYANRYFSYRAILCLLE